MSSFINYHSYPFLCCSKLAFPKSQTSIFGVGFSICKNGRLKPLISHCSSKSSLQIDLHDKQIRRLLPLKECAISVVLAVGLITGLPVLNWQGDAQAVMLPVLPDLAVLISGPPIKDPEALLRYALPVNNKAIREVQKPLEDITDSLKVAGLKALDSVERNLKQASRALKNGKSAIVLGLAESKKEHGMEMLDKLEAGMDELQQIVEDRNRDGVAAKQRELLQYVGS